MYILVAWLIMLAAPLDFTFTDPADFIFITLIPLTLMGIAWQHFRRPNSPRWIRFAERAAYVLAIVGPLVPLAVLYLASWRSFEVIGHWPAASENPRRCYALQSVLPSSLASIKQANATKCKPATVSGSRS